MKKKKIFTIGATTIALMIPVIGRMLGEMHVQSQYNSNKEQVFRKDESLSNSTHSYEVERMKSEYKEYEKSMEGYSMDFTNVDNIQLKNDVGEVVLDDVVNIEGTSSHYLLIKASKGYHIINTTQKTISNAIKVATITRVKHEGYVEKAIIYENENKGYNLQTKEVLYENVDIDEIIQARYYPFDISSGIPVIVKEG